MCGGGNSWPIAPICATGKCSHARSQDISKISANIGDSMFRAK